VLSCTHALDAFNLSFLSEVTVPPSPPLLFSLSLLYNAQIKGWLIQPEDMSRIMVMENASKARRGLRRGSIGTMSGLVVIAFRLLPLPACFGCYSEFVLGTLKFENILQRWFTSIDEAQNSD
jgi:hypothetical protein